MTSRENEAGRLVREWVGILAGCERRPARSGSKLSKEGQKSVGVIGSGIFLGHPIGARTRKHLARFGRE